MPLQEALDAEIERRNSNAERAMVMSVLNELDKVRPNSGQEPWLGFVNHDPTRGRERGRPWKSRG